MQAVVLVTVFIAAVLLVLGAYTFVNRDRLAAAEAARSRLRTVREGPAAGVHILRDTRRSAVPVLDLVLRDQPLAARAERLLEQAGLAWTVGEFLIGSALSAVLAFIVMQWAGAAAATVAMAVGVVLPLGYVLAERRRRARRIEMQLPEAIDMVVNSMRAGFSLQTGIQFVGEELPAPLGPEFARLAEEQRLGADTRSALLDLEDRVGSLDVKMFVTALLIQRDTGGNLADVLTGLADVVRERVALRDHIRTLTAEPHATAILLGTLPVLMFAALWLLKRDFVEPLLVTTLGHWLLAYAAGSVILGYAVLRRMAAVDI